MRHPLNWLARLRRSSVEAQALLGDLEEEYTNRLRERRSWLGAQVWYARELLTAGAFAMTDKSGSTPVPAQERRARFRLYLLPDFRYALRRWRRRPAFALTAILTLAIGIAAASAIFSIVDGVLLRPLPWKDPDSLVVIHGVYPNRRANPATAPTWNRGDVSYPVWDALRATPIFESVGVWRAAGRATTLGDDRTQLLEKLDVSSNFLPMLGVPLTMGRYFNEREDIVPSDSILISHELWLKRFDGRPDVLGERVAVGRANAGPGAEKKTIVGVVTPRFEFQGLRPEVLEPVGISAAVNREYFSGSFRVLARLEPGTGIEAAGTAAATLVAAADTREPLSARLVSIVEEQLAAPARSLWLLFGGSGLLLLVACANVAGLLLGEARTRRHEISVRASLGGTRARVIRQLLVEYTLMAVAGTCLGLVFAQWMLGAIIASAPAGLPRLDTVAIDLRVVAFAFVAGLGTLLIFGIAPAVSLARTPVARVLAEGSRDGAISKLLGQRMIVVAEIALALVLLTGAHLFGETILRLTSQPIGFDPDGLLVVSTTFTGSSLGDVAKLREAQRLLQAGRLPGGGGSMRAMIIQSQRDTGRMRTDRVLEQLAAVPGVHAAAGASAMPFAGNPSRVPVVLEGRPPAERHDSLRQSVTDRYFDVIPPRLPVTRASNRWLYRPNSSDASFRTAQ